MLKRFALFAWAVALTCAATTVHVRGDVPASPSPADLEFFENRIRPLLVERCYKCHSHKEDKDKGGLYLDSRQALLKGGDNGPAVVPGEPDRSLLVEAVGYKNVDLQMPPKGKLSDAEQALLVDWVKRGAPWPAETGPAVAKAGSDFDIAKRKAAHWAWQPVKRPKTPVVKNADWPRDDVDRFILARLESKGLAPAEQADKRTLIRRASFAITGLPPTVEEVEAFIADPSPTAFEKVVDRLLASPHFGERWGRHWLDLVRYAETRGHEFDHDIPGAFQYRDYVIRAFNADVPYDQFVVEHIAGDLLDKPRTGRDGEVNESVVATGFWFLSEWIHSPVDIRQDETDRVDNQIDVMGKTFLGLTIGCARCHDHKFDAISDEDYYALAGFLHSSSYRDVSFEHEGHNAQVVKRLADADLAAREKLRGALLAMSKQTVDRLDGYLLAAAATLHDPRAVVADELDPAIVGLWRAELRRAKGPDHPLTELAALATAPRQAAATECDPTAETTPAKTDAPPAVAVIVDYQDFPANHWIASGPAFGRRPPAAFDFSISSTPESPIGQVFDGGTASSLSAGAGLDGMLRTPTFIIDKPFLGMVVRGTGNAFICIDSHRMVRGPLHGVCNQQVKSPAAWQAKVVDLSGYIGHRAHIEFEAADNADLAVRRVTLSDAPIKTASPAASGVPAIGGDSVEAAAQAVAGQIGRSWQALAGDDRGEASAMLADWLSSRLPLLGYNDAAREQVAAILTDHAAQRQAILKQYNRSATAMAMLDGTGFDERLLIRGLHKTPGDVIPRRFLEALDGSQPMPIDRGSGRLQLARKIASADNPLTGRVIVNRVWHHLFGRGIVASTDNFGVLGDLPTHPELLDRLAGDFVQDGWSIKRLIRRLMLSRTWQMSSQETGGSAATIDPQNLLLHRANLRRLEGEAIRDQILAISGRLDARMFGPSVMVHLTDFMEGRGRPGKSGPMDGAGRRSIYTSIRRNFLPPMMLAFDMPQPFNTMGKRAVSNVPAQALILMNDPFVVEQAKRWSERVLADKSLSTPQRRIERMYQMAYARPPTNVEFVEAVGFIEQGGSWADLAHVLMNVKEFIYVP